MVISGHLGRRLARALMLAAAWSWVAAGEARAVQVDDLYQASVPVADTGVDERNKGIARAMERVLVKLTGNRGIAGREAVRGLVKDAPRMVQQYRYELSPGPDAGGVEGGRMLLVRFDQEALTHALRDHGLPFWGTDRPAVLLWMGLDRGGRSPLPASRGTTPSLGGGQRGFLQPEYDPELSAVVSRNVAERGLALLHPLLDLEDRGRLQAEDLWRGGEDRIREASARYAPNLILVGRLAPAGPEWRADWRLIEGERMDAWQGRGAQPGAALDAGLQEAADRIAGRFAPAEAAPDSGALLVAVDAVEGLEGFLRADRYLKSLDTVERVAAVRVEPRRVLWRVWVRGGAQALGNAAALGRVLIPQPPTPPSAMPPASGAAPAPPVDIPDIAFRLSP